MQEAKDPKASLPSGDDATSSETLSDVEKSQKVGEKGRVNEPAAIHSPDGAFDEQTDRSPKNNVEPM